VRPVPARSCGCSAAVASPTGVKAITESLAWVTSTWLVLCVLVEEQLVAVDETKRHSVGAYSPFLQGALTVAGQEIAAASAIRSSRRDVTSHRRSRHAHFL
jgi:hypothetical protein